MATLDNGKTSSENPSSGSEDQILNGLDLGPGSKDHILNGFYPGPENMEIKNINSTTPSSLGK